MSAMLAQTILVVYVSRTGRWADFLSTFMILAAYLSLIHLVQKITTIENGSSQTLPFIL